MYKSYEKYAVLPQVGGEGETAASSSWGGKKILMIAVKQSPVYQEIKTLFLTQPLKMSRLHAKSKLYFY